jgi:hypothetical protein
MIRALAPLCALLAGCVQLDWTAYHIEEPPPPGAVERLAVGDDADRVFGLLGAPTDAWEAAREQIVLVWAHDRTRDLGLTFSVALRDSPVSPSLALGDERANVRGIVVVLDGDLCVADVREGRLRDVAPPRRPRRFEDPADTGTEGPAPNAP